MGYFFNFISLFRLNTTAKSTSTIKGENSDTIIDFINQACQVVSVFNVEYPRGPMSLKLTFLATVLIFKALRLKWEVVEAFVLLMITYVDCAAAWYFY